MKRILFFSVFTFFSLQLCAQDKSLFNYQTYYEGTDSMPYRILLPKNYDYKKTYPFLYFLHGRGESGTNNEGQLTHGAKMFLTDDFRNNYEAIIVFPQCPKTDYWSNVNIVENDKGKRSFTFDVEGTPNKAMAMAINLLLRLLAQYPDKSDEVYVGGLSMGGMGTYEIVRRMPNIFAKAFAICGGANPLSAPQMTATDWWLFHGEKDDVVNPQFTKDMYVALKAAGAKVKLTLYPNANHNSWDPAFAEEDLIPWLFGGKGIY